MKKTEQAERFKEWFNNQKGNLPNMSDISNELNLAYTTVTDYMKELEEMRYIKVTRKVFQIKKLRNIE